MASVILSASRSIVTESMVREWNKFHKNGLVLQVLKKTNVFLLTSPVYQYSIIDSSSCLWTTLTLVLESMNTLYVCSRICVN